MKNRFVTVLCLAAMLFGVGNVAQAQFRQSIFLNGGLPTGQFGSKVSADRGIALAQIEPAPFLAYGLPLYREEIAKEVTPGFGLGYRISYRFDVGVGEVAPFAQADFFWNLTGGEWSDRYIQAKAKAPNYFNIPVMLGVSYLYDELWNDITPFAEFGVGGDLFFFGREKSEKFKYTYAYKPTVALSWMVGLGAYFGRHVSAGVYYYGLGKHIINYTDKTFEKFTPAQQAFVESGSIPTRTVGELALRIGFHF